MTKAMLLCCLMFAVMTFALGVDVGTIFARAGRPQSYPAMFDAQIDRGPFEPLRIDDIPPCGVRSNCPRI